MSLYHKPTKLSYWLLASLDFQTSILNGGHYYVQHVFEYAYSNIQCTYVSTVVFKAHNVRILESEKK